MKPRRFVVLLVVIGLLVAMSSAAAAQAPSGEYRPGNPSTFTTELTGPSVGAEPPFDLEGGRPWGNPVAGSVAQPAAAPDGIPIGQPELSFRYERTFGETEHAYLADTDHLNFPFGLGSDGSNIWVAELFGHRALKYNAAGGFLASIGAAGFWNPLPNMATGQPHDVTVDAGGNVWIAYDWGSQVGKFDASGKLVAKLGSYGSGDGQFQHPASIAFDTAGNVYVSDGAPFWGPDDGNQRVQIFDAAGHYLSSIGTTGVVGASPLQFHGPRHIAIYGSQLYVADVGNHRVQVIDISNPIAPSYIATLGTSGQSGNDSAHLNQPSGVAVDDIYIYVADTFNDRVQVFSRATRAYVDTIGSGWGTSNGQFKHPSDLALDGSGTLYVADWVNCRVQVFNGSRQYVRTLGTTGVPYLTDGYHYNTPAGVALAPDGSIYLSEDQGHRLVKLNSDGTFVWAIGAAGLKDDWNSTWANNQLNNPQAVWTDGSVVYVADQWHGRVQIYGADSSYRNTIWGLNCPRGVTVRGSIIYVAETCSHTVRLYNQALDEIGNLGQPGQAGADNAHFNSPAGVAVDSRGFIYVSDSDNNRIQVFDASRAYLRTIGQAGVSGYGLGQFNNPQGLAVDAANRMYVADRDNNRVQIFNPEGAYLATIGGSWGNRSSQFRGVNGVAVDGNGNVFITDWENHRIQKFAPGVPGWRQVNINGFGDRNAGWMSSLAPFQGSLYATGYPARIWRMTAAGVWSQANTLGFGDDTNNEIDALAEFNGQLYAATFTWVCDDPNCNTGHTNGPQIWRSVDGSTWQNVTPAGGIGSAYRWVASLVVFDGQLYAGLSGDATHGAEVWRTADGLAWTRVVENGFSNDVYKYITKSLVVYNGNLYAGTGHGDWYDDGHPNGPLGGEVWRTSDGTTWVQVNAPGFGNLEAHRVESLQVFQDGLYAYVSHVGGTAAGADVWRCTRTVCSEQSGWTQVVTNGFGVPENQYLYAGAVSGGYLYGAVDNTTTGMQLWRTANGADWEKATPYDGLGNSNNRYVYTGAMTVFDGRLTLGITNWASGAGVWQKTLTADFSATPTRGAPPLAVQFTNTSAGDFTSSQWDFGDGATSTETNPTHTYTVPGTYAVTLTVGDGTDTSTITKPGYIVAKHFTYLPLVMRNYDPLLYDDFNDPTWDGSYNPAKWTWGGDSGVFETRQESGTMRFTSSAVAGVVGRNMYPLPTERTWAQVGMSEAKLKISNDRSGGRSTIRIKIRSNNINGQGWEAACVLGGEPTSGTTDFSCYVNGASGNEYGVSGPEGSYGTWNTVRIEANPFTAELCFYLNGSQIDCHVPSDAANLVVASNFNTEIRAKNDDPYATSTRYVDDVRITPAR